MTEAPPFFTIGHSNLGIDAFIALLQDAGIAALADIRRLPGSRAWPQFDEAPLRASLQASGIAYQREAALGGRRGRSHEVAPATNGYWTNQSFHNYADYALSGPFQDGLAQLLAEGAERRTVLMCAEALWWRCHRRIVSDYLIANGREVIHIMGSGRLEPARLTPGAVFAGNGTLTYPTPDRSPPVTRP